MRRILGPHADRIYAIFRIVIGFLFACHGAQKLFGAFGGQQVQLASLMGLAGIIEFFGGLLVMIGLFTSWAAFLASGMMAVAYFMAHAKGGFWPIVNHGEPAVIYCFLFLYIASRGSGPYSLDSMLFRGRTQPATRR
jgi:putative oxidoreductase